MATPGDTLHRGFYFLTVYILTLHIHERSCTLFPVNGTSDTAGNRREGTTLQGKSAEVADWLRWKSGLEVLLHQRLLLLGTLFCFLIPV